MGFFVRNLTASNITVSDLGVTIDASSDYDLHFEGFHDVARSSNLLDELTASRLAILDSDGTTVLTTASGLARLDRKFDTNHLHVINELSDVDITAAVSTQVLTFTGSTWVNVPASTLGTFSSDIADLQASVSANASSISILFASAFFGSVLNDLSDVSVGAAASGQFLRFTGSTWEPGNAADGITLAFEWRFSTDTDTSVDPGNGRLRYNSATPASVTELAFDDQDRSGFDVGNIVGLLLAGDRIYVQQKDTASAAQLFQVTASAVDQTGFFNIAVSTIETGSILIIKSEFRN